MSDLGSMKKFEKICQYFPRLSVIISLIIYAVLLLVYYNHSLPLRFSATTNSQHNGNSVINSRDVEKLLFELNEKNIQIMDDENVERRLAELKAEVEGERSRDDSRKLMENIFLKADINGDNFLDIKELSKWIHAKIVDHINWAMKDNIGLFTAIDNNPRNGEISWSEYHAHFLRSHGLSDSYITSHDKRHSALSRSLKETIMRDRARWTEAACNDPDKLALDEFLAFTHPESSHRALLRMVDDLFEKFDRDGDEQLTEDEFSDLPAEGIGVNQSLSLIMSEERREEFQHFIDKNKNGKADRAELLYYIDPRNPRHAIQEAGHLIELSDVDLDQKLKLSEILSKMDLFLESKMVDTEGSFHDEFR